MGAPPTAAITTPANNQSYNLNQAVATTFSCTQGAGGGPIQTCADNNGTSGTTGTLHGTLDTSTAGAHTYKVTATSQDTQTATTTINYTVVGPPTATITSPADNQSYAFNQPVSAAYNCAEATNGPGIQACTDSNNTSGGTGALDTSTAGAHTYTVTATSKDGQSATTTIHYTVAGPVPPTVAGGAPTNQTSSGATPAGTVNPEGMPTPGVLRVRPRSGPAWPGRRYHALRPVDAAAAGWLGLGGSRGDRAADGADPGRAVPRASGRGQTPPAPRSARTRPSRPLNPRRLRRR